MLLMDPESNPTAGYRVKPKAVHKFTGLQVRATSLFIPLLLTVVLISDFIFESMHN